MRHAETFLDKIFFNEKLEKNIRSAHMTTPVDVYMMIAILVSVLSGLLIVLIGLCIAVFDIVVPFLPGMTLWLIICAAVILIPAGMFACFYYYPALEASGRKNKIEQDLPYAITYMQALSSTVTLYTIFRNVYDAADLYGEVSRECGLIVRDVELFGEDLLTAIENTIKVTPSENFRELLNDLALVYKSGGNLTNFFNAKSDLEYDLGGP